MTILFKAKERKLARVRRHKRVRKKITGTEEKPRLCVFRSAKHIYAQIIDDNKGETLCSASTLCKEKSNVSYTGNCDSAKEVGKAIAEKAIEKGIKEVCFDKGGYKYHGRIKALADSSREIGLKF
jgi:large subunit ribosomal protein L18